MAATSSSHAAPLAPKSAVALIADYALPLSDCWVPAGSLQNDRVCSVGPLDEEGGSRVGDGSAVRAEFSPAGYGRIIAQGPRDRSRLVSEFPAG
jgi:hypothetical protein